MFDISILFELSSWIIILTLTLMEGVLSLDNVTVIASMVKDIDPKLRNKAISYGMIGAILFRGLALLFVSYIAALHWVKLIGAIYLIWIVAEYFLAERKYIANSLKIITAIGFIIFAQINGAFNIFSLQIDNSILIRSLMCLVVAYILLQMHKGIILPFITSCLQTIGFTFKSQKKKKTKFKNFWLIVLSVELTDIAFSLDNVVVAVGMSKSLLLIVIGVILGMITMRFAVRLMSSLMKSYPFMDNASHLVIGLVGIKMLASYIAGVYPNLIISHYIHSHYTEILMTVLTLSIFIVPICIIEYKRYTNYKHVLKLKKKILSDGKIDENEVEILRNLLYENNNVIDGRDIKLLLQINESVRDNIANEKEGGHDITWFELFMDVIHDFCMKDTKQPGIISSDEQSLLMKKYVRGKELLPYERKALQNLISHAHVVSDKFMMWAQERGVKLL